MIRDRIFIALRNHIEKDRSLANKISRSYERELDERKKNITMIADIKKRIGRLSIAIERGVEEQTATDKICSLQDRLAALEKVNEVLPVEVPGDEEVRARFLEAMDQFERHFSDSNMVAPVRAMFHLLVQEITLTPVVGQNKGETMDISLRNEGWPEFWQYMC